MPVASFSTVGRFLYSYDISSVYPCQALFRLLVGFLLRAATGSCFPGARFLHSCRPSALAIRLGYPHRTFSCLHLLLFLSSPLFSLCLMPSSPTIPSLPFFSACQLPSTPVIPFFSAFFALSPASIYYYSFSPVFQNLSASLIAQFTELFSFFSITSVNVQRIFLLCQPHCTHRGRVACIGWPFHAKFAKKITELLPIITISSVNFSYVIRFSYQIRVT